MTGEGGRQLGEEQYSYFPATQAIIDQLSGSPTTPFTCSHGGEPAIGVYEVPQGCVALPGLETQLLCPQHILTDGSFEGKRLVVDLSLNGAWSKHRGDMPDFWMRQEQEGGPIEMVDIDANPLAA